MNANILNPTSTIQENDKLQKIPQEFHCQVGFIDFPNQIYRRAIREGFEFTIMVTGQSGLGKTTFVNSLFLTEFQEKSQDEMQNKWWTFHRSNGIQEHSMKLSENGISLQLTLIDCPGFGDAIDNRKCFEPIALCIEEKFYEYFCEETKIERIANINDKRVHLCLYFIDPSGHGILQAILTFRIFGLKPLDIMIMRSLHDRVNLMPIIAKADTMTIDELLYFKKKVLEDIDNNEIRHYSSLGMMSDDEHLKFDSMHDRIPFAIISSNQVQRNAYGQIRRCRNYPWGTVEVENLSHNDFITLRDIIIRSNLINLIDITRNVHYENFRLRQLTNVNAMGLSINSDPFTTLEIEKKVKEEEMKRRSSEMEMVFACYFSYFAD
uniref:Septin n=1 Tax=Elaeophora elaphi TaxID=1147741 RepID=A0A0R3RKE0_9BILA